MIPMDASHYIDDDIDASWTRCLQLWLDAGRVEDFPHGVRRPRYLPTFAKQLGQSFATTFYRNVPFFVAKLRDTDPTIRLIAFDLLEMVAYEYHLQENALPDSLTDLDDVIPDLALGDIRAEHLFKKYRESTVGSFLPFMIENG